MFSAIFVDRPRFAMVIAIVTAALFIFSDPVLAKRINKSAVLLTGKALRAEGCH